MAYITKINNYDIPCFNYTTDEIVSNDVSSNLINIIYPVGSVYLSADNTNPGLKFSGTTWVQIGTKLAVRENVFGNGKVLGLSTGSTNGGTFMYQGYVYATPAQYGASMGQSTSGSGSLGDFKGVGVYTKDQLPNNPEYSGLIVDTETIYSWKRTA